MDSTHTHNFTRALSRFCSAQRHGANIVQRLSKLTIWPATVLMSLMFANAALASNVLTINASDNPNNRIQLEGNLSATVTHTAEGLAIEIPGVEITLDCPNQQACTVSIGAAASYGGTAPTAGDGASSGGNDSSSGGGDTSAGGNSDGYGSGQGDAANSDQGDSSGTNSDGGLDDLCSSPRPSEYGAGQISWDKYCQDYDPNDPIDSGDGGNSGSDDTPTDCKGPGYACWSDAGGSSDTTVVSNAVSFPNGSARRAVNEGDNRGLFGFGSAGRNANVSRVYVDLPKGVVSVIDFTMSADSTASAGQIDFGVTADQPDGGDLHLWVSKDADGQAVSEACTYVGYAETAFRVSLDESDTTRCQLEPGGTYYLNLALCYSEQGDVECRSSQAMTAESDAVLAAKANWF